MLTIVCRLILIYIDYDYNYIISKMIDKSKMFKELTLNIYSHIGNCKSECQL